MSRLIDQGPRDAAPALVLAHGAGAPMDSPFMERIAEKLRERNRRVVRFEFPYMRRRRERGRGGPPDRQPVLVECWHEVIERLGPARGLIIGGKSMGGRIASMIADQRKVAGLVCLGYPFHPPGKPERTRTSHLLALATPALFLQGERDPFGAPEEINGYRLSRAVRIVHVPDGDHSLKPRVRSGRTLEDNLECAARAIDSFVESLQPVD